ncbi:MAG TPA: hypothetical protein VFV54_08060 [Thermoanaerobaculia bacterium]|nr:hypothetical protein [Thermoanaerobaculia bacterium]
MQRLVSAVLLGFAILIASCAKTESEPAARTNAPEPTTSPASEVAAPTTVASSNEPDPFEMTAPPPPADPNGPCVLGTSVGSDGNVTGAEVSFAGNDPIFLTVRPKEPLKELTVEIADPMGKRMQTFSGPLESNAVTHRLGALPRNRYRVIAFGGPGLSVCALRFEVR